MIVVDASALVDVLLRVPGSERTEELLLGSGEDLHAPELLDLEVLSALRRHEREGRIGRRRGDQARGDLADAPVRRHSHVLLRDRLWALRRNLTAYDAAYVALAEGLGATLVTRDGALARAAARHVPVAEA